MDIDDYRIFCKTMLQTKYSCRFIPLITGTIGTRLEEALSIKPEEIDLEHKQVFLNNCKNGRKRIVPIADKFMDFWKLVKDYCISHHWETVSNNICYTTACSSFRKVLKKINLSDKYPLQCNHGIRKLYAQRRFIEEIELGFDVNTSWSHVQQELGHGAVSRNQLFRTYIGISKNEFEKFLDTYRENPELIEQYVK